VPQTLLSSFATLPNSFVPGQEDDIGAGVEAGVGAGEKKIAPKRLRKNSYMLHVGCLGFVPPTQLSHKCAPMHACGRSTRKIDLTGLSASAGPYLQVFCVLTEVIDNAPCVPFLPVLVPCRRPAVAFGALAGARSIFNCSANVVQTKP
jgi:hypothetical protein